MVVVVVVVVVVAPPSGGCITLFCLYIKLIFQVFGDPCIVPRVLAKQANQDFLPTRDLEL